MVSWSHCENGGRPKERKSHDPLLKVMIKKKSPHVTVKFAVLTVIIFQTKVDFENKKLAWGLARVLQTAGGSSCRRCRFPWARPADWWVGRWVGKWQVRATWSRCPWSGQGHCCSRSCPWAPPNYHTRRQSSAAAECTLSWICRSR